MGVNLTVKQYCSKKDLMPWKEKFSDLFGKEEKVLQDTEGTNQHNLILETGSIVPLRS